MARLNNIWQDTLSRQDFNTYPIWTWDDANEGYHPTDELVAHPEEHGDLFIKCIFKAPDGTEFPGYLIGCGGFHAFGLFLDDLDEAKTLFNLNMPDYADKSVEDIRERIGDPDFQLFPLSYESEIKDLDGKNITGVFERSRFRSISENKPRKEVT